VTPRFDHDTSARVEEHRRFLKLDTGDIQPFFRFVACCAEINH